MAGNGDRPDDPNYSSIRQGSERRAPGDWSVGRSGARLPSDGWSVLPGASGTGAPATDLDDSDVSAFLDAAQPSGVEVELDDSSVSRFLDEEIAEPADADLESGWNAAYNAPAPAPAEAREHVLDRVPDDVVGASAAQREEYRVTADVDAVDESVASESIELLASSEIMVAEEVLDAEVLDAEVLSDAKDGDEVAPDDVLGSAAAPAPAMPAEPEPADDVLASTSASWNTVADEPAELPSHEVRRRRQTPFGIESAPPDITPLDLEGGPPTGEFHWLNQFDLFRAEVQRLARAKRWRRVAAVTAHAVMKAPYSSGGTRTAMLLDLARIYRDRLKDLVRAEEAFAAVAALEPENAEALAYLEARFEESGDARALYDLYVAAVESTWDPQDRLMWTRASATLAMESLHDVSLATRAWEQLWRLGDAEVESARELARFYRLSQDWSALVAFQRQRSEQAEGAERTLLLRELAEVLRFGTDDGSGAAEVLETLRREQPDDTVVVHQLCDVYADLQRWEKLAALVPTECRDLERLRLVGDTLWSAGRCEQAARVSEQILDVAPDDDTARERVETWLRESSQFEALVDALVGRADSTRSDDERIELWSEAAELADRELGQVDRAIELLGRRRGVEGETETTLRRLAALHRRQGDSASLVQTLTACLEEVADADARIDLLREIAQRSQSALRNSERAEAAWEELLTLRPGDHEAHTALAEIHRERGDHEALVTNLERQIECTADRAASVRLRREVAEYLDRHFEAPARAVHAWERVLNDAPDDDDALAAIARHAQAAQDSRAQVLALERRIRITSSMEDRVAWGLEVARLRESDEDMARAAAAYERVLHWEPEHDGALQGMVRILTAADRADLAVDALDHAASATPVPERRAELLRRTLELLPVSDAVERFERLRRIHQLSATGSLDELESAAAAAERWVSYAAVLQQAVSDASGDLRAELVERLCATYETRLDAAERAYLLRQSMLAAHVPDAVALDELERLALTTSRYDDWAAVLDRASSAAQDAETRRARLARRATVLAEHGGDALRAIEAWRRVLAVCPGDEAARAAIRTLAEEHDLQAEWEFVLVSEADRDHEDAHRLSVAAELAALAGDEDSAAARRLAEEFRAFRIEPARAEFREALQTSAAAQDAWQWTLSAFEGWSLSMLPEDGGASLREVAALVRAHDADPHHAFELVALSLDASPEDAELAEMLGELAEASGRYDEWARSLQRAAARSEDPLRQVELLRGAAGVFEGPLEARTLALDVHRRILELDPQQLASLDVVIAHLRESDRPGELRARLRESLDLDLGDEVRRERLLEAAALSEGPLDDVPTALHLYGRVLQAAPDDEQARSRMEALVSRLDDPLLRLEFLAMERESADAVRRAEIEVEMAQLQLERLDDLEGAIATLQASVDASGHDSMAFAPLVDLLRRHARWMPLADLLVTHARQSDDTAARLVLLRDALDAVERSGHATAESLAEVYEAILELDSDDRVARRALTQHYRAAGADVQLLGALTGLAALARSDDERDALDRERARLLYLNLEREGEAAAIWNRLLEQGRTMTVAHAALATMARANEDLDAYLKHRRALVATVPPEQGALMLCHLAEACDEVGDRYETMVELYREARRLHSACAPAMEALKAIGRRRRDLRPDAALLPEPGERELSWRARAERLHALATAQTDAASEEALDALRRAVSVDPDRVESWDALATVLDRRGDATGAYAARLEALEALRRSTPLDPHAIDAEAERLLALAQESRSDGDDETFDRLVRRVHELAPTHVPTALVVARRELEQGDPAEAFGVLDGLLTRHAARVPFDLHAPLLQERAAARLALDDPEGARRDLEAALIHDPIDAPSLELLAGIDADAGRFVEAIPHQLRALAVTPAGGERAKRFLALGVMWEDGLSRAREAGACFVAARGEGLESRTLLHRMLRHHQRTGALEAGLEVVDTLLEGASEPEELATLWVGRGEIFAAHDGREDDAIEAFDMALSYDPECDAARLALADVLERREDWDAALQILEGIAETATGEEAAAAYVRAAHVAAAGLGDGARAEQWLTAAVAAHPTAEAVRSLADVVGARAPASDEHLELLGRLATLGPPWIAPAMALGSVLLEQHPEWAWCLLSPALVIRDSDDDLKGQLRSLRREFERPPIRVAPRDAWPLADELATLRKVLCEVEDVLMLGRSAAVEVAEDASEVSMHSNVGRTFGALAEAFDVPVSGLFRSESMSEPLAIAAGTERASVVIRADVFQQLARAEIGFVLTLALELARSGVRGMASLPADHRASLVSAVFGVCQLAEPSGVRATQFASRLDEVVTDEQREAWAAALEPLAAEDGLALGARYWDAVVDRARRLGLLAGPDLFQAVRLLARMRSADERPAVFDSGAAFDAYVAEQDGVSSVIEAACSLEFGAWLRNAALLG